ncbi:hypothetical protein Zmor_005974 [Zophobas morio]|uniref:C2H2-type domain-containing protein n=1 Tax=Zophobas morio TaxID=2755281 RepID=A0AA38MMY9_9CUCU|nr:hypothetical protein Zmor_005974 [Zophobas morio]
MGDKNRDVQDLGSDVLKCPFCDAAFKSTGGLHKHKSKFHPAACHLRPYPPRFLQIPLRKCRPPPEVSSTVAISSQEVSCEVSEIGAKGSSYGADGLSDDFYSGNPGIRHANYFHARDSLRKHHKICPIWTSSSCRFCERTFDNYKGRKAHEQKSHNAQWNEGLEARLLVYQNGKKTRQFLPLRKELQQIRCKQHQRDLFRVGLQLLLEAMSCKPPLQEVQIPQACNIVTSIPEMVPRDECKSIETQKHHGEDATICCGPSELQPRRTFFPDPWLLLLVSFSCCSQDCTLRYCGEQRRAGTRRRSKWHSS